MNAIADSLSHRERAVYRELVRAADAGVPCPTNAAIADEAGVDPPRVTDSLRLLVASRHISIASTGIKRVVTITATGKSTGETVIARTGMHSRDTVDALNKKLGGNALAERIAADQARLRAEREAWLTAEQQRYDLPKRGRLPEDMAA